MENHDASIPPARRAWTDNALVKLCVLGFLAGMLLIPVGFVLALVRERESRLQQVKTSIASTWGAAQILTGPIISVPFQTGEGRTSASSRILIAPRTLTVEGRLLPELRRRGIFESAVYSGRLHLAGTFSRPDLQRLEIPAQDLRWDRARVLLSVSDPHALTSAIRTRVGTADYSLEIAEQEPTLPGHTLSSPLWLLPEDGDVPFSLDVQLRGSDALRVVPVGADSRVDLSAPWASPGFIGGYLPANHRENENGFTAAWRVDQVSRSYPGQWRVDRVDAKDLSRALVDSGVGVSLTIPADAYQQTERAAKYAILFIALTFGTFLLCELVTGSRLHPVQYLLIGAALCVYYLLLLSLTEHLRFDLSYWIAAGATITLIAGYARAVLASRRLAFALFGWLSTLYGYLYFILRLEDYALLAGALGLFALLAAFMWLTRRLNWYTLSFEAQSP